jgi:hypothetical protein
MPTLLPMTDWQWENVVIHGIKAQDLFEAAENNDRAAFCLSCQDSTTVLEPDTQGYLCQECGKPEVYSVMEIIIANFA